VSTIDLFDLHPDTKGRFITVEGCIGAGKSTFVENLAAVRRNSGLKSVVFPEPVDKPAFRRFLGRYYGDQQRWGLTFQMYALKERFKQHTLAAELAVNGFDVLQDRSIYTDSCFGTLVRDAGNMDVDEWEVYADTFGAMKRFLRYPDLVIYLRTTPQVCDSRIRTRQRSEESGIPMDYLQKLHEKHEQFAVEMARFTRVVVLDWDDFNQKMSEINERIESALSAPIGFLRDFNRL